MLLCACVFVVFVFVFVYDTVFVSVLTIVHVVGINSRLGDDGILMITELLLYRITIDEW